MRAMLRNVFARRRDQRAERLTGFRHRMYMLLVDHVRVRAWQRVLVVQSRGGWVAEEVFRRMMRGYVCGVDETTSETEGAVQLRGLSGRLEFKDWDGGRLPFDDEAFDTVISTFALDRFGHPIASLQEMRRVLRPQGRVYLLEPDRDSFGGLYAFWDHCFRWLDRGHLRYYTAGEMLGFLEDAGLAGGTELGRYERLGTGGKVLGTAVVLEARREAEPGRSAGREVTGRGAV